MQNVCGKPIRINKTVFKRVYGYDNFTWTGFKYHSLLDLENT